MDLAILHVKLVRLSVATITTFIIGVEFKISPGKSVKAMTHSMLNLKFLSESNEQKPTRNKEKHFFLREFLLSTVASVNLPPPVEWIMNRNKFVYYNLDTI